MLTEHRADGVAALESNRQKVKQCFTLNKTPGSGLRLSQGYGGGLAQTYIEPFKGAPRMKTDIEYQIKYVRSRITLHILTVLSSQRETLDRLNSELNELEKQRCDKRAGLNTYEQAIARHRKETNSLRIAVQRVESVVEELQDALDNDAVEEGRLEALKEHLIEAQGEVGTHEGSYEESVVALDKARESMKVSRNQMKLLDQRIAEAGAKIVKVEKDAEKLSDKRNEALKKKNDAVDAAERVVRKRPALEHDRVVQVETVSEFMKEAVQISPRVPVDTGETSFTLDAKLKKLTADLKKSEER